MRILWLGAVPSPPGLEALHRPLPPTAEAAQAAVDAAVAAWGGLEAVCVDLRAPPLAEGDGADGVAQALATAFRAARAALWELGLAEAPALTLLLSGPPRGLEAHALHGGSHALCRSIAKEYGRTGLRCNRLILEGAVPAPRQAAALAFLSAPAAAFLTGETLTLRGETP